MNRVKLFSVAPFIPTELEFLETLARNLWWCWNSSAIELFRRIDAKLWRDCKSNPLLFLGRVPQKRLEELAKDQSFVAHQDEVRADFEEDVLSDNTQSPADRDVAYFSLEYGIHESFCTYSGGLGVLAGDHLKSASDLRVPLIAVGLLYRQGYFQQYLDNKGWQQECYPEHSIDHMPVRRATTPRHTEVQITVPLPEGQLLAHVWRLDVGRVPLYLLDTNIPANPPDFRNITSQLYGGDRLMRLRQELLLGIGGMRAIQELGYEPRVCHMNEGHAAFLTIGRWEHLRKKHSLSLEQARETIRRSTIFTTHTPVPAGNESFSVDLIRPHLEALKSAFEIDPEAIIRDGQPPHGSNSNEVSMTILGLRNARYSNGVSKLHGDVARQMWAHLWPGRPDDEIPIDHITNGVHAQSWVSPGMSDLFTRYLGPNWVTNPTDENVLERISNIPDEELWRERDLGRTRLIRTARELLERQFRTTTARRNRTSQAKSLLDQDALTIGFARRFATYKRAVLLLRDTDRIEALLANDERPIQLVFAGKAHPADHEGKRFIQEIVEFARRVGVKHRVVFLENYDIFVARRMVQGVDVWLNTPRRPREASGTSGMKAAMNGALNLSILDGWWCEGYTPDRGWAIGEGQEYEDHEMQDRMESESLYEQLENQIIPLFYSRPAGEIPIRWIQMMKESIRMSLGSFTSQRMVTDYNDRFYKPAIASYNEIMADGAKQASRLVREFKRLSSLWNQVSLDCPMTTNETSMLHVGDRFTITTCAHLGKLSPKEVNVEVYFGPVDTTNNVIESHVDAMTMENDLGDGNYIYRYELICKSSGRYGFITRVTPQDPGWDACVPGFMTWADCS